MSRQLPARTGRVCYRLRTNTEISPFEEPAREMLVGHQVLEARQAEAARLAGLGEIIDVEPGQLLERPGLLFPDDMFLSRHTLAALLEEGQGSRVLCLPSASAFVRTTHALQGSPEEEVSGEAARLYDVFGVEAGTRLVEGTRDDVVGALREGAARVVVDPSERVFPIPMLEHYFGSEVFEIVFALRPAMRLRHWMHVMWANQATIGLRWREIGRPLISLWGLVGALRTLSLNFSRILGKMNSIGAGCHIHPTAVIEASVLGPKCFIGPHARIQFSNLGEGVAVQGGGQALFSVVGDGSLISQNCAVNFCTLFPQASASHSVYQFSLFGRRAITVQGSYLLDTHFTHDVKVLLEGKLVESGQRFLGVALGHRVKLGAGLWIPAGREVPNDYFIVHPPGDTAARIPRDLPRGVPLVVRDGRL
ncbi:MAG: hypothetical protein CMH57_01250 [Myxococcales bacterium]|nr:hypothetical protein [Myxococcales bacterium]